MIKKLLILIGLFGVIGMQSCRKHDEPTPPDTTKANAFLLYAVNYNNLSGDFINNRNQILKAADKYDPTTDYIYIYGYENGSAKLQQLVYTAKGAELAVVKDYGSGSVSTTKDRITEVMRDFERLRPASRRTLFLWGHGLGPVNPQKYYKLNSQLTPVSFSSSTPIAVDQPDCYAFGGEYPNSDFIDIDQLAEAIPDGLFDTIWFDCCYMGSIEIAYQLRNDCKYFVAYPTEIWSDGLPYHRVMPKLTNGNYSLIEGAKELYNHYASKKSAVTVAVMDMSKINPFAESFKNVISQLNYKPSFDGVNNYSRLTLKRPNNNIAHPYYDLMGWINNSNPVDSSIPLAALRKANADINNFVIYKATYVKDFTESELDTINFCGLSVYDFNNDGSERDLFYQNLDWYKDIASNAAWLIK